MIDLSIVLVNWNTRDLLAACLQSIRDTAAGLALEILVVDNASTDGSQRMVQDQFPDVQLLANPDNVGFARANNQAIALCRGRYILLLNSDTRVLPGALQAMQRFMDTHHRAGIAGVRLLNPDGSFQASYTPFPTLWQELLILTGLGKRLLRPTFPSYGPEAGQESVAITGYMEGACLIARREAVATVGGLDERIFMYAEDVDWCYRFHQAGWEVWYLPHVSIIHHGGQSTKKKQGRMEAELYRSRVYFFYKHHGRIRALVLCILIYMLTLPKMVIHHLLRWITRGRRGRVVASWSELRHALRNISPSRAETITG